MEVRAKELCYHFGRRRPGAVFNYELAEGAKLPPWLEPVEQPAKPEEPKRKRAASKPEPAADSADAT